MVLPWSVHVTAPSDDYRELKYTRNMNKASRKYEQRDEYIEENMYIFVNTLCFLQYDITMFSAADLDVEYGLVGRFGLDSSKY